MAKVMRRPYPQVSLCQDCGNGTPGAIKHHITLHLTPSSGNVSSTPLPVPLLDQNLNLIARKHKYRRQIPLPHPFATHLCLVSVVSKHKLSLTSSSLPQIWIFETSLTSRGIYDKGYHWKYRHACPF